MKDLGIRSLSVDMSNEGHVVAIGTKAPGSSMSTVIVYELEKHFDTRITNRNKRWRRRGDAIFPVFDSVYAVSLSGSGNAVAVGYEASNLNGNGFSDITRTYIWDQSSTSYIAFGNPIVYNSTGAANRHSQSLALSESGNVLAVTKSASYGLRNEPGVEVFVARRRRSANGGLWVKRGSTIRNGVSFGGWPTALNGDGSILAIGNGREGGSERSVRVYEWQENGDWNQLGSSEVDGGPESALSLSFEGYSLAVGLPYGMTQGSGRSTVYEYPDGVCGYNDTSLFHISVTAGDTPNGIAWDLIDTKTSNVMLEGGPYDDKYYNSTFATKKCFDTNQGCRTFMIYTPASSDIAPDEMSSPRLEGGIATEAPMAVGTPFVPITSTYSANYTVFINGDEISSGSLQKNSVALANIGSDCPAPPLCPSGTRTFRMVLRTCVPVSWIFGDNESGRAPISNNNFDSFYGVRDEDIEGFKRDCIDGDDFDQVTSTYYEEACLPVNDCGTFVLRPRPRLVVQNFMATDSFTSENKKESAKLFATNVPDPRNTTAHNFRYHLFLDNEVIAHSDYGSAFGTTFRNTEIGEYATKIHDDQAFLMTTINVGNC